MIALDERGPAIAETTLNQLYRPAVGGLQILEHNGNGCTLGFNVFDWSILGGSSPLYFLTAGHCSGTWGQTPRGWPYYQPSSSRVGEEFATVTVHSTGYCPTGHSPCMEADVLAVKYDDTVSVLYGNVANVDASKNITGYLNVQGMVSGAIFGQTVTFVGQVSGKRTATIRDVCKDQWVAGPAGTYWILCQSSADYVSTGGDSGAPIFIPYQQGNQYTPSIVGIHSSTDQAGHKWFSPIDQIDFALNYAFYYW
jgi:hypothetical protein